MCLSTHFSVSTFPSPHVKAKQLKTMSAFSYTITSPIRCQSGNSYNNDPTKNRFKVNGTSNRLSKVDPLSQTASLQSSSDAVISKNGSIPKEQIRQNIPTKKQCVDPYRQGLIIEGGVGYRQTVVIRSYEVGADKTATLESILNLLQETALNHVWMSGLLSNGFGATHGMVRNNLIWVVSRMHAQVDHYPIWGEIVDIDTWVGASGKNGMRRDWLIRSQPTGQVLARATSTWVMMNQTTRRLSKMPEEVRAEISPWFIEKQAIEEVPEKISKLNDKARYMNSNLKPKRSDLDMNHHVNNVKYVRWMLETIPDQFLEDHQLSSIVLEYRRECGSSDIVQSLCEPDEYGILARDSSEENEMSLLNRFSLATQIIQGNGLLGKIPPRYTHLLKTKGEAKSEEIVRGKTEWKRKLPAMPFPSK